MKILGNLVPRSRMIIGDPYDKPSAEYWRNVMNVARIKNKKNAVVVDDSPSVIHEAIKFGFDGIVMDRDMAKNREFRSIRSFDDLAS